MTPATHCRLITRLHRAAKWLKKRLLWAVGGQFCSNSQVPVKIHGHSDLKSHISKERQWQLKKFNVDDLNFAKKKWCIENCWCDDKIVLEIVLQTQFQEKFPKSFLPLGNLQLMRQYFTKKQSCISQRHSISPTTWPTQNKVCQLYNEWMSVFVPPHKGFHKGRAHMRSRSKHHGYLHIISFKWDSYDFSALLYSNVFFSWQLNRWPCHSLLTEWMRHVLILVLSIWF